ncbi:M4 family metallopeptidase [Streptomyces sp. NPDC005355]|uniref:M4 family metallopeptidase n=1 Tax=Streptomyces sp. NPDC005355 TaxID=3157038 RepID=UPI00339F2976
MLAVAMPTGTAAAHPVGQRNPATAHPRAGALAAKLSPAQQAKLVEAAKAGTGTTARELHLGARERLVVKSVAKDADGTVHTRYERTYDGLPVLGGDLVVHRSTSDALKGVTKATSKSIAVANTTPTGSASAAKKSALARAEAKGAEDPKVTTERKVIWAASGQPKLAWETVVGGLQDDGTPNALHVITDARTGAKLFDYQGIESGTGTGQYNGSVSLGTTASGSSYTLTDGTRGGHKTYDLNQGTSGTGSLFTDADDVWGNGSQSNRQTAAVDAAFGAQVTWDYYKNVHGRTGIRGDGVGAYSRVHYGNNYANAFWDDSCFCMTYGDGSGNAQPLTSLDVAAHEMTHGVTSNTAGLNYSGESGGLNEATSDIFGSAVEWNVNSAADPGDYLIGEKININGNGTPLRYMDKPSKDGGSKDSWYSGIGGIDVHYSSGPANHWFYLASEGSGAKVVNGVSYNSPTSDGLAVTAIGRDAAAKIWYRALSTYMTSTTNYAGARSATLSAAADLYGSGSATYNNTANAWAAVNVGSRVGGGGGGGCTAQQLLANPGFESGSGSWTATSGVITSDSGQPAHSGSWKAWLDGYGTTHTDTLSQSVTVPSGCKATLSFWLHTGTQESGSTAYDTLKVQVGSSTLATYSNANAAAGYVQKTFDLSSYAGQTITLKFTGTEDSSLATDFVIDDTAINIS